MWKEVEFLEPVVGFYHCVLYTTNGALHFRWFIIFFFFFLFSLLVCVLFCFLMALTGRKRFDMLYGTRQLDVLYDAPCFEEQ